MLHRAVLQSQWHSLGRRIRSHFEKVERETGLLAQVTPQLRRSEDEDSKAIHRKDSCPGLARPNASSGYLTGLTRLLPAGSRAQVSVDVRSAVRDTP